MAEYPFNINVGTLDGQLEVLRLWSDAALEMSMAASILKVSLGDVLELARPHGIEPPSVEALDQRVKDRRIESEALEGFEYTEASLKVRLSGFSCGMPWNLIRLQKQS
jgi:hypothetical protein